MARLEELPEPMKSHIADLPCPHFEKTPGITGPELSRRRVAIISTAGLHSRKDRPFGGMEGDYRVIAGDTPAADLVMTHISTNFDRTGFQQDWNLVFPIDRLHELAADGVIGSVADYHFSFMGATDPSAMEPHAQNLAALLAGDNVDAALLVPV
jgi:D-proline reductase (dithiol) PrdB